MLIQCENCQTIFNLDETLLKEGGSRVRCSRCKHPFMVYPPTPKAEDVAEEAPVAVVPPEEGLANTMILMGDEEGTPPVLGKDEAFEAELESVYKDALLENDFDLDEDNKMAQDTEGGDKKAERGAERKASHKNRAQPPKKAFKKQPSESRLRAVLLVVLLALLAGAAAIVYLKPELVQPYLSFLKMPEKEKPADPGVRLLQFESVGGSFVDSEKGGQLFVIRGMVRNQYPKPRSHMLIKGSILDNRGKEIEKRVAYAGNTFTEDELKTLPIQEILKAMQNRDGMARQNVNVASGGTIPFMIVFDKLPDNLSEFAVEAVSSSPGI